MRRQPSWSSIDAVLVPFLQARTEDEAEAELLRLLDEEIAPVVKQVVERKLRVSLDGSRSGPLSLEEDQASNVYQEAICLSLQVLQALRTGGRGEGLLNLRGYVARIASNAFHQVMRDTYPQRARLKNTLRYLLERQEDLALWRDESGEWLAGLSRWRQEGRRLARSARYQRVAARPQDALAPEHCRPDDPETVARGLFALVAAPIELDDLVGMVLEVMGGEARPVSSAPQEEEDDGDPLEEAVDPGPSVEEEIEQREWVRRLWALILELPLRQRIALLLHMRCEGRPGLELVQVTGVASLRQIAAALAMQPLDLAERWNDLPLDDHAIGRILQVARQQVINLRMVARRTLAKRMTALDEGAR